MASLISRPKHETALSEAVAGAHEDNYQQIRDAIGDPPSDENLNTAFWLLIAKRYQEVIQPLLEAVYLDAAEEMDAETGQDVDMSSDAAAFAANYAASLAASMVATRRDYVIAGIAKAKKENWTLDELLTYLMVLFSVSNAEGLAVTEITTTVSAAAQDYSQRLAVIGLLLHLEIHNDFDPCDFCEEFQGQDPNEVGYPPFHKHCRCYVDFFF